ncbi:helix-turn-helix transcriptional regulator, partial [Serratia nevei]|uniref:helix-turn-helix transcriptional regulator n=1 Tax=Serratia nevei TaxID=2703794 RepID=UPI00254ACBA0
KSQLLAHPVTHSGFRLQHDDLTSRTYSHLPKFCALAGISMKSYIRSRKMTEAAKMILSTDRKIIDIALEYGYLEQQAFCRIFKNHYGVSPTMFRKMNKPREDIWISAKTVLLKLTNDRK